MALDRNRIARRGSGLVAVAGLALLTGCSVERAVDILTGPLPTQISLEPQGVSLPVGQKTRLRVVVVPERGDPRVEWVSSNPAVASVDRGEVTCHAPGAVVITATSVVDPHLRASAGVACIPTQPGQPPPSTQPPPGDGLVSVSPGSLRFEHVVGSSPCPQVVGEFEVTNRLLLSRVFVTLRAANGAIEISPSEFQLEAGETRSVRVVFNCSTQQSFSTNIILNSNDAAGNSDHDTVQVTGNIS